MKALKEHLLTIALILTLLSVLFVFGYMVTVFEEYVLFVIGAGLVAYGGYTMYNGFLSEVRRELKQREYRKERKNDNEAT